LIVTAADDIPAVAAVEVVSAVAAGFRVILSRFVRAFLSPLPFFMRLS
jgi:hypothetical protein